MTKDEAVKAMVRLMSAYPTFCCSEESMVTLAEVLLSFPREVAFAASSPIHGVPNAHREFPPNAGQISEWCEREAAHLFNMAKFESEGRERRALPKPADPPIVRPTQEQLDAQFERLGLTHLRPGSKFHVHRPRVSDDDKRQAQAMLDRYAAEAKARPASEAAE